MRLVKPKDIRNTQYFSIGAFLIILNYFRHRFLGYKTTRAFPISKTSQAVEYDLNVVRGWVNALADYTQNSDFLKGKVVLELGPGADLGIGLILLAMGARKYIAFDVNPLARNTPVEFYDRLLSVLSAKFPGVKESYLRGQLEKAHAGNPENLEYIVDSNFYIAGLKENPEIVFGQAAFEHFFDIQKSLSELSGIVKPGCVMVSLVDLKTHTAWIRPRDPLNIYRYGRKFWGAFQFAGSPNRIRSFEYKNILENNHWHNVKVEPLTVLEDSYVEQVKPTLSEPFRSLETSELRNLSIMLLATKS